MPVTLRQLRYFQAVVEHGSFSRAAESVYVSQPALSLQIRELESTLGAPLFERESRGVFLTQLGREAHQQTQRVLDEALLLETMGKRFGEGPFRITLGIVSTVAPYLLGGLLAQLQAPPSRVELDVTEATSNELTERLLAGRLDAAILSLPLGMMELAESELFEDRFLVAGRAERLAAFRALRDTPTAADLAQADIGPLLTVGEGHCLGDQVLGACSMWRPHEVHRGAASLATLARLVASGAGLTLLPESAALGESAASPDLRFVRLPSPEPSRRIGFAHHMGSQGQPWIDVVADAAQRVGQTLVQEARDSIGAHDQPSDP